MQAYAKSKMVLAGVIATVMTNRHPVTKNNPDYSLDRKCPRCAVVPLGNGRKCTSLKQRGYTKVLY